jgi:predicted NACHT family NTPase
VRINKPVSLVIDEISETFGDSNIKPFVKEQDARKLYLEDVFSRSNTLAITGIELASRMSEYGLDSLYVPLLADKSNNHPGISSFSKSNNHTRTSIVKLLNQHRFVVVLGDAGSGKSTLVNYLCACFSGEILERRPSIRNLLSELSGDALTKAQWEHGSLIPVKILLRDYAAWAIQSSHYNLWDYVSYLIDSMGLPHYKSELYNELTHDGGIILFDGFDEIPRDGNVLQRIRNEIQTFYEEFPKCRMLLTSRPYAYDTSYFNGVFTTTILQFNKEQIDKYIDNWFSQLAFQSNLSFSEVQIRAEVLKSVIRENEQIYYLAQNPLILTLIVISYARGQQLADDRVGVLSLIMDFFLERWDTNKVVRDYKGEISIIQPGLDEYNKIGGRRFRRAINELAYRVQEKQSESNEMAQIEKDDIIELLSRRADNLNVNYSSLLDYLINRSGILVQRTTGTFTFSHRVFQEFLAASHLAETDYPEMAVSLFMQRPEKWREVIVLTGGIASRGGSFAVVVLANELCAKEPDSKSSTKEAWGAFAASLILMENLKQREPNNREKPVIDRLKKWMQYIDNKDILPSELDFQIKNIRTWLTDH